MANSPTMVVQLDRKVIKAIERLALAIETSNQIERSKLRQHTRPTVPEHIDHPESKDDDD